MKQVRHCVSRCSTGGVGNEGTGGHLSGKEQTSIPIDWTVWKVYGVMVDTFSDCLHETHVKGTLYNIRLSLSPILKLLLVPWFVRNRLTPTA